MLLIPLDMPKNCDECPFLYESRGYMECKLTEQVTDFRQATTERLPDCPLVEVPTPHGRLIDADDLTNAIECIDWYHHESKGMAHGANSLLHQAWYKEQDIYAAIKEAPTIIPEDKEGTP